MAYNKLRKLLGMKPKADKTTSEKGITTVTDYFPDFSVKEVAEYREDGSQLSVSRYSKGQISEKTDYLVDGGQTFSLYSEDDNPVAASVVPRIKEAPRRESARNDVQKLGGCCHNWWWGNGSLGWIYDLHGRYLGGGAHLCVQGRRLNPD